MPAGTFVHNIELQPGKGAQMARSAGTQAQLVSKEGDLALVKLPSGEIRRVPEAAWPRWARWAISTTRTFPSARRAAPAGWASRRTIAGSPMNPVDHPHGGGEGRTSGGRNPVTPWGQPTRGFKTRNNKRTDKCIVTRKSKKR